MFSSESSTPLLFPLVSELLRDLICPLLLFTLSAGELSFLFFFFLSLFLWCQILTGWWHLSRLYFSTFPLKWRSLFPFPSWTYLFVSHKSNHTQNWNHKLYNIQIPQPNTFLSWRSQSANGITFHPTAQTKPWVSYLTTAVLYSSTIHPHMSYWLCLLNIGEIQPLLFAPSLGHLLGPS